MQLDGAARSNCCHQSRLCGIARGQTSYAGTGMLLGLELRSGSRMPQSTRPRRHHVRLLKLQQRTVPRANTFPPRQQRTLYPVYKTYDIRIS